MEFNSNINDHSTKLQVQVLQSLSGLESTSIDSSTSCDSSSTLLCEELVIDGSKAVNINVKEIQVYSLSVKLKYVYTATCRVT